MYGHPDASSETKGLAPTPPAACTAACTSERQIENAGALDAASLGTPTQAAGTAHADPLTALAGAIANLSPADRARLAAMLGGSR
jgi:hypothetical protein